MKITNTARESSNVTVELELSSETIESGKTKAYIKAKKDILLPGFRKGHAPRKMIESFYGADVFLEDAIDELYPQIVDYMTDNNIQIVGMGSVQKLSKLNGGAVLLTITIPVYPEVTLGQYKGLEVPRDESAVTEEEIDQEIEKMADQVARIEFVEREAREGDTVYIDYEGFVDGVAFDGGANENEELVLGSNTFIPGFEEQLIGMRSDEEKEVAVTFPDDYDADLAGKSAVFHVKLNEIKTEIRPELDDEFVKDVSEFDTMEELRADLRAKRVEENRKSADRKFRAAAIEMAVNGIQADIPECMVEDELKYQYYNLKRRMEEKGIQLEQYMHILGGKEAILNNLRSNALFKVREGLMLTKVAQVEGIEVSEEEIEAEYVNLSEQYGGDINKTKIYVPEKDVKRQLQNRKVIALIAESAIPIAPKSEKAEIAEVEAAAEEEPEKE